MNFDTNNADTEARADDAPVPEESLGQGFDTPLFPSLLISTKSRIWGDAAPGATEPAASGFTATDLRDRALRRDKFRCRFCGFESRNNGIHNANDNHNDIREDNLWTADQLCHGWSHLGELGADDAVVAYLPGLSGQDVNHLQRSMMVALESGDDDERADALALLNWAASHRDYVKQVWGTFSPAAFSDALARLNDEQRGLREIVFHNLALVFHPAPLASHAAKWVAEAYAPYPLQRWRQVHHDVMNAPI
ncbi:HNH endonuclease [Massilia atriviolacea]|uniref:HNH endonuclease n=1 Tax=Massilia atriviolacea TaxID=2495579 RepID=A0A430HCI4_9BURK|nr:HNH endonuclease [Massilia atriviolacea]RSZ55248.1 HNH endonuclease [Massilia atriviolacea]